MWHREMGGLHLPASVDPRCVVSLQCRFQLDETTDRTHTFSTVPESVEAKRRLPYLPRGEHGYAQITERFIVDMWRSKSLCLLLSSPAAKDAAAHADSHIDEGVDLLCQPGDVVILNNSNIRIVATLSRSVAVCPANPKSITILQTPGLFAQPTGRAQTFAWITGIEASRSNGPPCRSALRAPNRGCLMTLRSWTRRPLTGLGMPARWAEGMCSGSSAILGWNGRHPLARRRHLVAGRPGCEIGIGGFSSFASTRLRMPGHRMSATAALAPHEAVGPRLPEAIAGAAGALPLLRGTGQVAH